MFIRRRDDSLSKKLLGVHSKSTMFVRVCNSKVFWNYVNVFIRRRDVSLSEKISHSCENKIRIARCFPKRSFFLWTNTCLFKGICKKCIIEKYYIHCLWRLFIHARLKRFKGLSKTLISIIRPVYYYGQITTSTTLVHLLRTKLFKCERNNNIRGANE